MFLSSLEILGFKSFARKTVFRFPEGITAIVGPNGCGKTNVVDAIRWVLGEQRAGILRSERMENVIFNGSASAPPLGMAEVSITIQNTRNVLPIEFSEVKITRRLFRSGESQYLLNDAPCRLKDIQNLFLDTGLAPDAYSVIELAMVEQILNGKTDDRRRILEEAAGIGKYKVRRRAAFRKLEATEADLLRLNDLISEVERNVRSLQVQVRRAEKAREIQNLLREKDLLLSGIQLHQLTSELNPLSERLDQLRRERDRLQTQLELEESEIEQLQAELADAESALAEAQQKANQRAAHARSLEKRLLILRERARSTEESLARISRELTELEIRSERIEQEKETARQSLAQVEKRLATIDHKLQRAEEERRKALRARDASRAKLTEAETQFAEIERHLAQLEIQKEKLRAQLESLRREAAHHRYEQKVSQQELGELAKEREALNAQLKAAEAELRERQEQTTGLRRDIQSAQAEAAKLRQEEVELASELEKAKQRLASLERLLETHEDRPESLRYLLRAQGLRDGVAGLLADQISVPDHLAQAIAAALGPLTNSLLVKSLDIALTGVRVLKRDRKGVATFVTPQQAASNAEQSRPNLAANGIIGWADDLVKCRSESQPIIRALLGNVLIVENEETALRLAQEVRLRGTVIVTPEGTVIRPEGYVQGGHYKTDASELFDRRNRAEALRRQVEEISARHSSTRASREQLEVRLKELEEQLSQADNSLNQADRKLSRLRLAADEMKRREEELTRTIREKREKATALEEQVHDFESELEQTVTACSSLQRELDQMRQKLEQARQANAQREQELQVCDGSLQQIRLEKVRATAEQDALRSQLDRLERERQEVQELTKRRKSEEQELRERLTTTQSSIERAELDLSKALEMKEAADEKVEIAQRRYTEQRNKIVRRQETLRRMRDDYDNLSEQAHQLELKISELTMRAENLRTRVEETWHTELKPVEPEHVDPGQLAGEIEELRKRLERMGPVNELAIEEYNKEKDRLDFLNAQRDDLLQAKENLLETIDHINRTARERFLETFETVRRNFTVVFQNFFQGGEADLRLSDPKDPLESEIEILARPRGKKIEALSLLSAGEKALAALAFLFAIYLVKPSPFCILDEVDAPLDDNNVENFVKALRKFSENTQFIVATHNKITMKAADALYGVTMQRDGISKVVSVRFEEELVGNAA